MVENLPTFYFMLFASAVFNPYHSALCGFVWGIGRLVYGLAYAYGPEKRFIGEFFYAAEIYMLYIIGRGCYGVLKS